MAQRDNENSDVNASEAVDIKIGGPISRRGMGKAMWLSPIALYGCRTPSGSQTSKAAEGKQVVTLAVGEAGSGVSFPPGSFATSLALGEEAGVDPGVTTQALNEEGGDAPPSMMTSMALHEEGGEGNRITTLALNEEGGRDDVTTLALGEEGGGFPVVTTQAVNEEAGKPSVVTSQALGEEGAASFTSLALGEEGGDAGIQVAGEGGPDVTTLALGEEGGVPGAVVVSTQAVGEEGGIAGIQVAGDSQDLFNPVTTQAVNEEGGDWKLVTTQAVNEEGGDGGHVATTLALNEEGGDAIVTTLAVAEEGAGRSPTPPADSPQKTGQRIISHAFSEATRTDLGRCGVLLKLIACRYDGQRDNKHWFYIIYTLTSQRGGTSDTLEIGIGERDAPERMRRRIVEVLARRHRRLCRR